MKLYLFDSCPFCVPVRAFIGLKGLDCQLSFAQAGQVPSELGSRIDSMKVPLLSFTLSGEQRLMAESRNIIRYLDQLEGKPLLSNYRLSSETANWLSDIRIEGALLCYPRMPALNLPELGSEVALDFFHSSRAQRMGVTLEQALQQTPTLTERAQPKLERLVQTFDLGGVLIGVRPIIIDDLYLFAELRNLASVKELTLPGEVKAYLTKLSRDFGVPLYPVIDQHGQESVCHD